MRPRLLALGGLLWLGCAAAPRTQVSAGASSGCPAGRRPVAWSSVYLDIAGSKCALAKGRGGWEKVCWSHGASSPRPGASLLGEVQVWRTGIPASVASEMDASSELFSGFLGTCIKTRSEVACMAGCGEPSEVRTFVAEHMASSEHVTCMSQGSRLRCLGDGVHLPMRQQADFVFASDITEVAIGIDVVCVVLKDGTASCLSSVSSSSTGWETFGPSITHVASSLFDVCAYDEARRWVRCKNREGSLAFEKVVKMVSDSETFCVLTADAEVLCWPESTSDPEAPNARWAVKTVMTGVANLWAGRLKTCALTLQGTVSCWGLDLPVERARSVEPQLICL